MASFFAFLLWNTQFCHWLLLVRANVRKHTQANNVKNPLHVMQHVCDSGLFSKLPLASTLMAKSETIKANTRCICSAL